jgi:hypothetical protein
MMRKLQLPPIRQAYTFKDSILYALGLGYGEEPLDQQQPQFVYEQGQRAVPSMAVVLGYPGFWLRNPNLAVDWVRMLHGEHAYEIHREIPPAGVVRSEHDVPAIEDKGDGKGALLYAEKRLYDEFDTLLATIRETLFMRGDGGSGSYGQAPAAPEALPKLKSSH